MAGVKLNIRPFRACGKQRHYTVAAAERHRDQLAALEHNRRPSAPPLTVYYCANCDAFHVGHTS
jgi:hypothetical protein